MYQITVSRIFSAAHAIRIYDGSLEPLHGHNWTVEVTVEASQLDAIEVVMDFHQLEKIVDELIEHVHNKNLNEIAPFGRGTDHGPSQVNPTAERVAWWLGTQITQALPEHAHLASVRVGEASGCTATYRP